MKPYQQRVVDEKTELDIKLNSLKAFIMESPIFKTLPTDEQKLLSAFIGSLNRQYDAMLEYSNILRDRVESF